MKYLKKFENHSDYEEYIVSEDATKPNVSYCVDNKDVHYNPKTWADEYLKFVALEDTTFSMSKNENAALFSLDGGETWTELAVNTNTPTVERGNKIMWKGEMTPSSLRGIGQFSSSGQFDAKGNIMSLLFGDNFKGQTNLSGKDETFRNLFSNSIIVNAKDLVLPATTLAKQCYISMFASCTSLISAPQLPATTLASGCYADMFNGCTSLTTAPELPAITLVDFCYNTMFNGCTSLTTAPELPAITLVDYCYYSMFSGCTSLNYIKAMFTTTPKTDYNGYWVRGVSNSGTFVKNSAATWNVSGFNGIPNGWTVETTSA